MFLQRLDTDNANTKIVAYFDSMTSNRICFMIQAIQVYNVDDLSSSLIEVIDYYSPGKLNLFKKVSFKIRIKKSFLRYLPTFPDD